MKYSVYGDILVNIVGGYSGTRTTFTKTREKKRKRKREGIRSRQVIANAY